MIVTRNVFSNTAILKRQFRNRPTIKLTHASAIDLLPGRCAGGHRWWSTLPTPRQLLLRHQHVAFALVDIDENHVIRLKPGQPATGRAFRRGIEDRRTIRRAGLTAVANGGQAFDPALEKRIRRL